MSEEIIKHVTMPRYRALEYLNRLERLANLLDDAGYSVALGMAIRAFEQVKSTTTVCRKYEARFNHLQGCVEEFMTEFPYKEPGNRDSYSQYNEGWQDALDRVSVIIDCDSLDGGVSDA